MTKEARISIKYKKGYDKKDKKYVVRKMRKINKMSTLIGTQMITGLGISVMLRDNGASSHYRYIPLSHYFWHISVLCY